MNKKADPFFSWGNAKGSYWNTINPLSGFMGGGDRVPAGWMNLFDTTTEGKQLAAGLAFKTLACSLLAAGLVGGYRAIKHFNRVSEMAESDSPAKKMRSQLGTTFVGKLTPSDTPEAEDEETQEESKETKTASRESKPDGKAVNMPPFSTQNLLSMSIPLGATMLAAGLAYGAVDSWASARRNRKLDEAIHAKDNAAKALMRTRARIAKGLATDEEVESAVNALNSEDLYVKEAAQESPYDRGATEAVSQGAVAAYGLLMSVLLLASAVGSYKYFHAANPNNIKYKVSKRSLADYARSKTGLSPVTVVPTDMTDYFKDLDQPAATPGNEQQEMRELPQMSSDATGKPVTVTL